MEEVQEDGGGEDEVEEGADVGVGGEYCGDGGEAGGEADRGDGSEDGRECVAKGGGRRDCGVRRDGDGPGGWQEDG